RIDEVNLKQRRFIADASHELRSPITTVRHRCEVTLTHPRGATAAELAQLVLADSLRLEEMVDDLLVLARAGEAPGARSVAVDLDDLALDALARVRAPAGVEVDASAVSGAQVLGDPHLLSRMIRNLVDNAVRHARSRVVVRLHET